MSSRRLLSSHPLTLIPALRPPLCVRQKRAVHAARDFILPNDAALRLGDEFHELLHFLEFLGQRFEFTQRLYQ
jgi:hypothetical protein